MSIVTTPPQSPFSGVIRSFSGGFDRLAARPYLILPPLALDFFLWLGPRLHLESVFRAIAGSVQAPPESPADVATQAAMVREAITTVGAHFNLFSALSSFPIGVPSLMASTMPAASPLGRAPLVPLTEPARILLTWLALTAVGLGLAALYHLMLSSAAGPTGQGTGVWLWFRILAMSGVTYLGMAGILFASLVAASLVYLVIPFLVTGVAFLGFTLMFWLAVYLAFTPHGIIRSGLGLVRAMRESVDIVRTNFFSTVIFLTAAVLLSWMAGYVWDLPASDSWFEVLAIIGHAFVSAMLLVASYIFYASRREAMLAARSVPTVERVANGRVERGA